MAQLVEKVESFLFAFDRDELYKITCALHEVGDSDLADVIEAMMEGDEGDDCDLSCEICGGTH